MLKQADWVGNQANAWLFSFHLMIISAGGNILSPYRQYQMLEYQMVRSTHSLPANTCPMYGASRELPKSERERGRSVDWQTNG